MIATTEFVVLVILLSKILASSSADRKIVKVPRNVKLKKYIFVTEYDIFEMYVFINFQQIYILFIFKVTYLINSFEHFFSFSWSRFLIKGKTILGNKLV